MNLDAPAVERIKELEEENADWIILNDLKDEEIADLKAQLRIAKGQLKLLLSDHKVADVA